MSDINTIPNITFVIEFVPYHPVDSDTWSNIIYTHPNIEWALLRKYTTGGVICVLSFDILHTEPESKRKGKVQ